MVKDQPSNEHKQFHDGREKKTTTQTMLTQTESHS